MFDTSRLSAQIVIKGALPNGRFEDQEILDLAYDCLLAEIVPAILVNREDYYVTPQDVAVSANQAEYSIPSRALNGIIREVKLVDSVGNVVDLSRMEVEGVTTTQPGTPTSFYTAGNSLVLYPTPSAAGATLRIWYFARPSRLVPVAAAARITAIDALTRTVSVTPPGDWGLSDVFDLVRGRAHFDALAIDQVTTSVDTSSMTFASDLPISLVVGDYVTRAEETCFPQLQPEGHVALIQAGVAAALEAMGDPNADRAAARAAKLLADFRATLATRVQGAPKAIGKRLL